MNEHTTHQKIALITGANKGIGRATAEQLTALGMTVLIAARNPRHGESRPKTPTIRSQAPSTWTWSGRCSRPTSSG